MSDESTSIAERNLSVGTPQEDEVIFTIYDKNDPDSLIQRLNPNVRDRVLAIHPRFYSASEEQLEKWCKPTEIDRKLRILFWEEYNRVTEKNSGERYMRLMNVWKPVCTVEFFHKHVLGRPHKLAYMVTPGYNYSLDIKELHALSIERMRRALLKDPFTVDKAGKQKVDTKLLAEQVKIFALIDNRAKGAVLQRVQVDQRSLNVNVNATSQKARSVEEIEAEIKSLEAEIRGVTKPQLTEPQRQELITLEQQDAESETVLVGGYTEDEGQF